MGGRLKGLEYNWVFNWGYGKKALNFGGCGKVYVGELIKNYLE